ncbi:DUF4232 domain-containing protein [Streptomyces sp. SID14478]|uniref:DUF4232 domain-containing protein n=1 Tax=Streptomyces sp. SID14478 TaxID=2706073 RepID=UPI0013DA1378|nr:DUF4232 domain-containing protein [Streptomyces sp. SID14478]NEB75549.1 DUF4232 domain-containing protein [Streptomyces sp. SID14478]
MKYTRITALAALGVATTLSLTACGGGDSAKDSSSKGSSSSSSSAPASSSSDDGSQSQTGSGSGDSKADNTKTDSGTDSGTDAANGAAGASGKATFCKTEDLAIDAQYAAAGADEGRINITMINRGSTTCSATGFAGVDIKDEDHTSSPIERGPAQPRVTTLKPGDAAVFDLAYPIDHTGKSLASPTDIIVTPPNETHSVTLDWPAGAGAIKGAYPDVQVYPTHTAE